MFNNRFRAPVAVLAGFLSIASACGGDDPALFPGEGGERIIEVSMIDNAFHPDGVSVSQGETVTVRFTNNGAVAHDAFIGDEGEQAEHAESMGEHSGMDDHNTEGDDAVLLEPGQSGEITHTFEQAGEVIIGCHQPGHYEAGMKSTVTVS